jgi:hypothetical protein
MERILELAGLHLEGESESGFRFECCGDDNGIHSDVLDQVQRMRGDEGGGMGMGGRWLGELRRQCFWF